MGGHVLWVGMPYGWACFMGGHVIWVGMSYGWACHMDEACLVDAHVL